MVSSYLKTHRDSQMSGGVTRACSRGKLDGRRSHLITSLVEHIYHFTRLRK